MNFEQLLTKLKTIDEGAQMAPPSEPVAGEGHAMHMPQGDDELLHGDMDECGMDMMPAAPHQSDSVTMSVSMNGAGKGGIRDLMDILRNIEDAAGDNHNDVVIGMANGADMLDMAAEEGFANEPTPDTYEVDDVVNPPSNDLAANHGDHRMRQTGLPRAQMESLIDKLAQRYQQIKEQQ